MLLIRLISNIKKDEKEFDRVKDLIDKLRASPMFFRDFAEMRLKEQHRGDVEDQDLLTFSVLCTVEKGKISRSERESATAAPVRGSRITRAVGG
jgi:hypothetical protein